MYGLINSQFWAEYVAKLKKQINELNRVQDDSTKHNAIRLNANERRQGIEYAIDYPERQYTLINEYCLQYMNTSIEKAISMMREQVNNG